MECMFCGKQLITRNHPSGKPITIQGRGVAHALCAEQDLINRRIFANIHITDLTESDLYELRELVLLEINERAGVNAEDAIELF